MSNLRSDCRDLVKDLPAGDVWKAHVERLCLQIDAVEECWHSAERKATHYAKIARLFDWCCSMACTVQRNSILGVPDWSCLDVDGCVIGSGYSPADAIEQAMVRVCGSGV